MTIKLGISACLLGQRVRYDGQHKLDRFLTDTLGRFVDYVPVCPEVECGLTVPREAMRLVGDPEAPRLVTRDTGRDLTGQMLGWARARVEELAGENLCGFIFKSKSPSSGLERVKVYNGRGGLGGRAPGMFARVFMARFPLLPVEDEGRLHDPELRENFIERVFALQRYRAAAAEGLSVRALTEFHARNKFLLMSHDPAAVRELGRLAAAATPANLARTRETYEVRLLAALKRLATVAKNANVLRHLQGYFKRSLSADEKQELGEVIEQYRGGWLPLIVPVALVRHYARKYGPAYLQEQSYLDPHPLELKLRNHA